MALGILGAMGVVASAEHHLFVGELSLDGSIRPVRGALSIAACARKRGIKNLLVPADNAAEAAVADGVDVFGIRHLSDAHRFSARAGRIHACFRTTNSAAARNRRIRASTSKTLQQGTAKRALEVAAAGGHNVLTLWTESQHPQKIIASSASFRLR